MLRQTIIELAGLHSRPEAAVSAVGCIMALTYGIILSVVIAHS